MITPLQQKRLTNTQKSWQVQMQEAISTPEELWQLLDLPKDMLAAAHDAHKLFPLKVPHSFIQRMQKGDINDPLLQQVLPLEAETFSDANFTQDPVADLDNNPVSGIVHKYHGRVLLIATGACAIHCRYCFRRHFPYQEQTAAKKEWQLALDYIQNDTSIHEVILSGGDPLSLSNQKLSQLFSALEGIRHVKTIRIHTRQAIVLPSRIDQDFISVLSKSKKNLVIVMHVNHAKEINPEVTNMVKKLKQLDVHVLNQSVMLKGINDDAKTLIELSHALFASGILPYYLNVLDKVSGASHFAIPISECINLHNTLKTQLSGYLVPKLVQDQAKTDAKTWL